MKIVVKRCYNDKIVFRIYDSLEKLEFESVFLEQNTIKAGDPPGALLTWTKKPAIEILADSKHNIFDEIIYTIEG